jgi:hypothetical protein
MRKYTGYTANKRIYEGDITEYCFSARDKRIGVVVRKHGRWEIKGKNGSVPIEYLLQYLKVIGGKR